MTDTQKNHGHFGPHAGAFIEMALAPCEVAEAVLLEQSGTPVDGRDCAFLSPEVVVPKSKTFNQHQRVKP